MIDPQTFKQVLGRFATGVTVVTTKDQAGQARGLTANAFSSLSIDPPLVLFCLDKRSSNLPVFQQANHFAVNLLADTHKHVAETFASPVEDRFQAGDWQDGETGSPVLRDALGGVECETWAQYEGGDHIIFVGNVVRAWIGEGDPLLYYRGKLAKLDEAAEKFRF